MNFSLVSALLLLIATLSSARPQWGGWGNRGGSEVIERDITTINNGWGGSETIEKDIVIENNNGGGWGNGGWGNGWGRK